MHERRSRRADLTGPSNTILACGGAAVLLALTGVLGFTWRESHKPRPKFPPLVSVTGSTAVSVRPPIPEDREPAIVAERTFGSKVTITSTLLATDGGPRSRWGIVTARVDRRSDGLLVADVRVQNLSDGDGKASITLRVLDPDLRELASAHGVVYGVKQGKEKTVEMTSSDKYPASHSYLEFETTGPPRY